MAILTKDEMYAVVRSVGAERDVDQAMVTGAKAESGWNSAAVGDNGHSVGLYQMHDQGLGAGMTAAARADPITSSTAILPHYRDALYAAAAEGYTDVELIVQACLRAERPYDWENPQSAAAQGYRAAYYESLPPESPPIAPPVGLSYNPQTPVVTQNDNWSCSCCTVAWALQSLGFAVTQQEIENRMVAEGLVSPALGLLDGSAATLQHWLEQTYDLTVERAWPASWDALTPWCGGGPLLLGGSAWNHWSAGRGGDATGLPLANPAPSWQGVGQHLDKSEWDRFGPWAVLWIPAAQ